MPHVTLWGPHGGLDPRSRADSMANRRSARACGSAESPEVPHVLHCTREPVTVLLAMGERGEAAAPQFSRFSYES